MAPRTVRNKPKPFSWSYSKLKNFETCPKRHWHIDIQKDVKEPESTMLKWGNEVHDSFAKRIGQNIPLPITMQPYEVWAEKILRNGGEIKVEQKLAITKEFGPCEFFDDAAWFRAVGDVIKVVTDVALIVDWKTGKILEDSVQLALAAACVFAHYPQVTHVRSVFVWLKEDAETTEDFAREDMPNLWRALWPRIEAMKQAAEHTNYPPRPSGLCKKFCPVKQCPHNGTGSF